MGLVAAVGAHEQSTSVVQPGEGALDDPTVTAEPGAVRGLAARDHRLHSALPDEAAVLVVVVAAVGDHAVGPSPRPTDATANGWHAVEQLEQLGDVVAVAAGERPRQRDAAAVYEEMLLAAAPAPVDRAGTRLRAPFSLARGSSRRSLATTRSRRRRAARPAALRAAAARRPPAARRAACAKRSCRSRSRAPAADAPNRPRCAARTRSPATPADHRTACAPDSENGALVSAATARSAPTTHPRHPTASPASTSPPP